MRRGLSNFSNIRTFMCGVAGVVSSEPQAAREQALAGMLAAIIHRGPDDEGVASASMASIGVRRLSIVDVAGGHQPMRNEDGTVLAVQNGEIYNYTELRAQLIERGHRFTTRSDTEVLPHAYEEWGTGLVPHLRGMFSLAIWDERRRRLLLARDRFGKKPLLYARTSDGLIFGSEIHAVLGHPHVSHDVDDEAIDAYLSLGYVPAPLTAFKAIRKLPPAHTLTLENGAATIERYWRLAHGPKVTLPFEEAVEELRSRLDEAVRVRLMGDVPIGVFLSGGLDSSTVVAFMARHLPRVRTFAIGFTDGRLSELPHARVVAQAFGTEHEELIVDHQDASILPELIRHVGEPFADSSIVPTYHVARITRPHVTVALTGDGGDEIFLGYDRYRASVIGERLASLAGPAAGTLGRIGRALPAGQRSPRLVARAARLLAGLEQSGSERYLQWSGYFTGELRRSVIGPALPREPVLASALAARAYDPAIADPAERYAAADLEMGLPGDLLVKMDIATMAASLEARSPLLDHELAEFVGRLPADYKLSGGRSKRLLRHAMTGILPELILQRGKAGFMAPVGEWLRGPLREMWSDLVPSGEAVRRGWVTRAGVDRLHAEHLAGRADRTRHLWSLLVLEVWWRELASRSAY